jgi:hypothetical protein
MLTFNNEISEGLKHFEGAPIVVEPPATGNQIADLVSFILFCQEPGGYWLPLPGDPERREFDNYDRIYYTFHAVSALIDVGFSVDTLPIKKAIEFFDSFPGVSINYRPFYYLYLPLGKMTDAKLCEFIRVLRRYQLTDEDFDGRFTGGFILPQSWVDESGDTVSYWHETAHVGGAYFHACHLGYFLSQISRTEYPNAFNLAQGVLDGVIAFLKRTLQESGRLPYSDGKDSPDLTLWIYWLADYLGIPLPENHLDNIEWAAHAHVQRFMLRCFVTMNLVRLSSKIQMPPKLNVSIEENILNMYHYLIEHNDDIIKRNPRDASIAIRTHLQIGTYLDRNFRYRLFSHLLKYFLEQ